MTARQLTEFIVLDIEPIGPETGEKVQLAEAQVARVQDFGKNDTVIFCKTHLGGVLKAGDMAWGYDVAGANMVDPEIEKYRNLEIPDVVLVRKSYSVRRPRHFRASWPHRSGCARGRFSGRRASLTHSFTPRMATPQEKRRARRERGKERNWKLKRMAVEAGEGARSHPSSLPLSSQPAAAHTPA